MSSPKPISNHGRSSRTLLAKSVWCGTVCGLALTILSLNILPPSQVEYEVESELVLAASQIETLERAQHDGQVDYGQGIQVELASFEAKNADPGTDFLLAADSAHSAKFSLLGDAQAAGTEKYRFIIRSIWKTRCTPEAHEAWVRELAEPDPSLLRETKIARSQRFARWEVQAAEHYLERQTYLHSNNQDAASASNRVQATLASFRSSESIDPAVQAAHEDLLKELSAKRASQFQVEQLLEDEVFEAKAQYQIVGEPRIRLRYSYVPLLLLASTFAVGIFSGASAGLIHSRSQSGISYTPSAIADQLAIHGLPIAGKLTVTDVTSSPSLSQRLGGLGVQLQRFVSHSLIRFGEWAIAFWVLLLALRCSTDSMWRQFFIEQPLIAIANLLIGLP